MTDRHRQTYQSHIPRQGQEQTDRRDRDIDRETETYLCQWQGIGTDRANVCGRAVCVRWGVGS